MTSTPVCNVTPRDINILRTLEYIPLTARQLFKASSMFESPFTAERKVRARLQQLEAAGQVRHWQTVASAGRGGLPNTYSLTRSGYRLLHGIDAEPPSKKAFSPISIAHQLHTHGLAEFLVHTLVTTHAAGVELSGYFRENAIRLTSGAEMIFPDGGFQLCVQGHPFSFFVEFDTGTERLRSTKAVESWQKKIRIYEAVQDQHQRYRTLVVCTGSRERLNRILDLAATMAKNPQRRLFYGVHLDDYLACDSPYAQCFQDHWHRPVSLVPVLTTASMWESPEILAAAPT